MELRTDVLAKDGEVLTPRVCMAHALSYPSPQLLNVVEPRSVGGEEKGMQPWVFGQSSLDRRMGMHRPVVHDQVDPLRVRIQGRDLAKTAGQPPVVTLGKSHAATRPWVASNSPTTRIRVLAWWL